MGSISTTVDVDIDYDEISDDEICDIIEDRINDYHRKINKGNERYKKNLEDFVKGVKERVSGIDPYAVPSIGERTLYDEFYDVAFRKIKDKFTLEEVEAFAKTKGI